MLLLVTLVTLFITVLLISGALSKKVTPTIKRVLQWYSVVFIAFTCALVIVNAGQKKDLWVPFVLDWFSTTQQTQYVSATGLSKENLEPIVPLINQFHLRKSVHLTAPQIHQYPELPRGCEVTSLAMLLQYHKINVDKMTLAEKIEKDSTPYRTKGNLISFGDPHKGFVGNMYDLSKPGYGVYHKPIASLADEYAHGRVIDFTGGSFYEILAHLNSDRPVWIITNTTYKKLPKSMFQQWNTPNGLRTITMKEHSVLVTGYDREFIYFNDPLGRNKKAPISDFREAWVQMGKQAITIN